MKFSVKKLSAFILLVLGTVSCSSSYNNGNPSYNTTTTTFNAILNSASETPPNASTATGTATLTFDSATKKFSITVTHNVQNPTIGHVHKGDIGVSGDPVFSFPTVVSPFTYTSPALKDSEVADLFANLYYVNIHSQAYPNGEIRGQLLKYTPPSSGGGGY